MATGKSDDELIQLDNKMKIGTRSGKFRTGHDCVVTLHDANTNDDIHDCVTLHDADTNDDIHDCVVTLHDANTNDDIHDCVVTLHDADTNDDMTIFTDFHNV